MLAGGTVVQSAATMPVAPDSALRPELDVYEVLIVRSAHGIPPTFPTDFVSHEDAYARAAHPWGPSPSSPVCTRWRVGWRTTGLHARARSEGMMEMNWIAIVGAAGDIASIVVAISAAGGALWFGMRRLMHPLICRYQITPKISLNTRCSASMLPNFSIKGRLRSSGQLGRW